MLITILIVGHFVVTTVLVGHVLLRRKEPTSMMAWTLTLCLLPILGPLIYFVFGESRVLRKAHRRRKRIDHHMHSRSPISVNDQENPTCPANMLIAETARNSCGMPLSSGNSIEVLDDAEGIYSSLEDAIRRANQFVHLQFYIWQNDQIGTKLRDLLVEKARDGVEVRLLLDSYGSSKTPNAFLQPLKDAGGQVAWFLSTIPIKLRWSLHLRNHRKLTIVDGDCAFVGSQNVGDEYLGRTQKDGTWYDCQLKLCGPVIEHLQTAFAEDWSFAHDEHLTHERYYANSKEAGSDLVQVLATGPDTAVRQVESVLFDAFINAEKSITIVTPYFVPSTVIIESLKYACRRGVHVRIVHPLKTDRKIILWAGRSFYENLFASGAEIFELPVGMLHSKIAVVDDRWACVGSTNMDIRSFRLNFELSTLLFDSTAIHKLQALCEHYFKEADKKCPQEWAKRGNRVKIIEGAARMAAPLL